MNKDFKEVRELAMETSGGKTLEAKGRVASTESVLRGGCLPDALQEGWSEVSKERSDSREVKSTARLC